MFRSVIKGIGSYLPDKVLTNDDLSKMVDTSDAWIRERTGILERRIASDKELTSDLAILATRNALANSELTGNDIDLIVLATTTPDDTLPATACKVQAAIGMKHGFAFDVQAVCSGFLYALSIADSYIRTGAIRRAVVVGAETLSRIVDWTDRNTCVLFGDGAGAVILEAVDGAGTNEDNGILSVLLRSDGRFSDLLTATGGISKTQTAGTILMSGRDVFRHAVDNMSDISTEILNNQGIATSELDYIVPHQANIRIIESVRRKLGLSENQVILTLPQHGNTSAASIPLALSVGVLDGRIKKGDLLLLESMGGGFTWGSALIRF